MLNKDKFTRFTVEQSDRKIVWETPFEDISGEDCIQALETLMTGLTFLPTTIRKSMQTYIDENPLPNEQD